MLAVEHVSVRFGGLRALDDVGLDVAAGSITGLIGPNGAGKTTCFNVICGLQAPARGRVVFDGKVVTRTNPYRRARLGIARTFQRLEPFGSLTVLENVLVAAEQRRAWDRSCRPGEIARDLLDLVGIADVADDVVGILPTGTARLVDLARALAIKPRVLLLDEPSSGLDEAETAQLGELLRRLVGDGLAVLLVEHDMAFVMGVCATIHVLDLGRVIASGSPREVRADPAVQAAYLGAVATEGIDGSAVAS